MDDEIPPLSNVIIQFPRAIASREDDAPLPPPDGAADDNVHLRTELEGMDEDNDHEDEEDENRNQGNRDRDGSDDENEEDEEEGFRRRQRRHVLRPRLWDQGLSTDRHDRILDWAELEHQPVTFGLQLVESFDGYVTHPGDYIDATGYDDLLQNLAESGSNERRGAPRAAKWAVEELQTVEVKATNTEFCAVCKDAVFNNEQKIVKQLPCGHMYHGVCIVPWLDSRNTCPVCRHELPTDDPEYEEDRKQRSMAMASTIDHGCSSSSGSGV